MATFADFFTRVLQSLGLPASPANLNALADVAIIEGKNDRYNPLNSVVPNGNSTAFNSVGVQDYKNWTQGIAGTVALLQGQAWSGVRAALGSSDTGAVLGAFSREYATWGSHPNFNAPSPGAISALLGSSIGPDSPSSGTAGGITGADIVSGARRWLGVPYVYAGESPSGFDCSGLVQYVLKGLGINVPRVAADQANVGTPVASLAEAQAGDLLFFNGGSGPIDHVGIYVGNNQMIAAPTTGDVVKQQSVYATPVAIRRVLPAGGAGVDSLDGGGTDDASGGGLLGVLGTLLPGFGSVFGGSKSGGIVATVVAASVKLTFIAGGVAVVIVGTTQLVPRQRVEQAVSEGVSLTPEGAAAGAVAKGA